MPYLVQNRAHAARIRDGVIKPILAPIAQKQGYDIIAVWENGFRQITNSKRPIKEPEDLKGIKLRVPKGVWRVRSEEHTSERQSLMRISYAVFCLKKKNK